MVEGILWVGADIKEGSAMTHGQFNRWYSQIHVPDVLNTGAANFAIRFKNLDDARKFKYLAAYNVPSLSNLSIQGLMALPTTHSLLGDNNAGLELDFDLRAYKLVQRLEGPKAGDRKTRGMVTTCVDLPDELDDEFDDWFNKQHLEMVSMIPSFIRGTRYKLVTDHSISATNPLAPRPKYVTLYEYDTTDFPSEQLAIVAGTQWSKKLIPQFTKVERDTWIPLEEPIAHSSYNGMCKLGLS